MEITNYLCISKGSDDVIIRNQSGSITILNENKPKCVAEGNTVEEARENLKITIAEVEKYEFAKNNGKPTDAAAE